MYEPCGKRESKTACRKAVYQACLWSGVALWRRAKIPLVLHWSDIESSNMLNRCDECRPGASSKHPAPCDTPRSAPSFYHSSAQCVSLELYASPWPFARALRLSPWQPWQVAPCQHGAWSIGLLAWLSFSWLHPLLPCLNIPHLTATRAVGPLSATVGGDCHQYRKVARAWATEFIFSKPVCHLRFVFHGPRYFLPSFLVKASAANHP